MMNLKVDQKSGPLSQLNRNSVTSPRLHVFSLSVYIFFKSFMSNVCVERLTNDDN